MMPRTALNMSHLLCLVALGPLAACDRDDPAWVYAPAVDDRGDGDAPSDSPKLPSDGAPSDGAPSDEAPSDGAPSDGAPSDSSPDSPAPGDSTTPPPGDDPNAPYAVSQRNMVQWKRYAAIEADLMRGLELDAHQVCQELGERSCIRDVHLVALGGNDPFGTSLTRPSDGSSSTTPLAVDRVVLSACSARARADRMGQAKVFTELDLNSTAPAPDDPAVDATITALFRRLVARDPKQNEATLIKSLLTSPPEAEALTAEQFAALSCFVVASSLEFLFF